MSIKTNWVDPYLEKLESVEPAVFQELLQEMVKFPALHGGLCQNFGTPTAILTQVIESYKDFPLVPHQVLGNANCPRKLVDHFINDSVSGSLHLQSLATNENLNRHDLDVLISFPELASSLAGRSNLPADLFIYIWTNYLVDTKDAAFSLNLPVLKALACNPKTPLKILRNLSKYDLLDAPGLVKSLLMSNPALPSATRAQYALLGFKPGQNILDKVESTWYPTNEIFDIAEFPDHLLVSLIEVGHPGGYLRTDVIPPQGGALGSNAIFDLWISDQSIYKTLWPELSDIKPFEADFKRWYSFGEGFTYFDVVGIDLEHEERQDDGELNYHAIPGSPTWLPYEMNFSDAQNDFYSTDFQFIADSGILEWAEAWNLSNYDSEYISLVVKDNLAMQFIFDQRMDIWEAGLWFDAIIEDDLCKPYGWNNLSSAKKAFLIEFIKGVFVKGEDGYYQYAEHFLICIALNPHTEDELIEKFFVDQLLDSHLIQDAIGLRGTGLNVESDSAIVDRFHPILWRITKEIDEDDQEVYWTQPVNGYTFLDFFTTWPEQVPDDLDVEIADMPENSYFEDENLFEALDRIAWKDQSIEIVLDDQPINEPHAIMEVEEKTIYVWWIEDGERQEYFFDSSKEDLTYALGLPLGREFGGIQILFVKE